MQTTSRRSARSMRSTTDVHDFLAKVIIIGDSGVGKTNLLTKFCEGSFKDNYVATIGVDFKIKSVDVEGRKIKLQIWDTAGQERFRNITQTYYKGASGIILAYSVSSLTSFKNITNWIKQLENNTSDNVSKMLAATKCDLQQHEREVQFREGKQLADHNGMTFMEVSAKNGLNVDNCFLNLAKEIRNRRPANADHQFGVGLEKVPEIPAKKACCVNL